MVTTAIKKGVDENPYLTTRQIACGQGIGFRPGSADMAGASYERLNYQKNKALRDNGVTMKGVHIITEMEKIADKIDEKDNSQEGSVRIAEQ